MSEATFEFDGVPLLLRPGVVMTPRATTQELVVAAARLIGDRPATVADVGTGSGAIAVAIARRAPRATLWATDTCVHAVLLARANARLRGVGDRVHVLHGDLLDGVPGPVDLVVANLPYLPHADRDRYPDLRGEPDDAVFADGDGLDPYRRLLGAAEGRLSEDGAVIIQLHRRALLARRPELAALQNRLASATLAAIQDEFRLRHSAFPARS